MKKRKNAIGELFNCHMITESIMHNTRSNTRSRSRECWDATEDVPHAAVMCKDKETVECGSVITEEDLHLNHLDEARESVVGNISE